jgi:hypothetical protein
VLNEKKKKKKKKKNINLVGVLESGPLTRQGAQPQLPDTNSKFSYTGKRKRRLKMI